MKDDSAMKVNCFKCKHYRTTWDPQYPRSCELLGFKTKKMPSLAVYSSTGEKCTAFEGKK